MKYPRPSRGNKLLNCVFCNKEFSNGQITAGHQNHCELNPKVLSINNKIKLKSLNKNHSEITKRKISKSRILYLQQHPDKVPYLLNHSSKQSYPELIFENALKKSNIIGWKSEFRNSMYSYDFAFPQLKLDVEIDGRTHNSNKVKLIDRRRDDWSKNQGWIVLRFTAEEVKRNVIGCIKKLKDTLATMA